MIRFILRRLAQHLVDEEAGRAQISSRIGERLDPSLVEARGHLLLARQGLGEGDALGQGGVAGMVDDVVDRREQRAYLVRLLGVLLRREVGA